jgi:hypothetical protein
MEKIHVKKEVLYFGALVALIIGCVNLMTTARGDGQKPVEIKKTLTLAEKKAMIKETIKAREISFEAARQILELSTQENSSDRNYVSGSLFLESSDKLYHACGAIIVDPNNKKQLSLYTLKSVLDNFAGNTITVYSPLLGNKPLVITTQQFKLEPNSEELFVYSGNDYISEQLIKYRLPKDVELRVQNLFNKYRFDPLKFKQTEWVKTNPSQQRSSIRVVPDFASLPSDIFTVYNITHDNTIKGQELADGLIVSGQIYPHKDGGNTLEATSSIKNNRFTPTMQGSAVLVTDSDSKLSQNTVYGLLVSPNKDSFYDANTLGIQQK